MTNVLTTLSLGCGVQSSTIAEMIVEGELPPIDIAIFADTGDEPDYVYDQRDYLKDRLASVGIPLETVQKESLISAIYRAKGRFASIPCFTYFDGQLGMMKRQCTREYKIAPIERLIRRKLLKMGHAKETKAKHIRAKKGVEITTWLGISLDEAIRMKDNRVKWIKSKWPLIELRMTRLDCANWLTAKGLPLPNKSSCRICPFHSHAHWKNVKETRPEDWEHVLAVDEYLRTDNNFTAGMKGDMFLYSQGIPLKEIDFSKDDLQDNFFDLCDEGYCFI
ncbi:hypothetical protein LCGC14_0923780 [marine sediment metagenome]|uniref:Phosphoadenosine phosphosulphate reductase domain-containing protein n=1 Tax=marine sediment metagenome TaxID=412755 RepID=A0A0F9RWL0_9ZZZZ